MKVINDGWPKDGTEEVLLESIVCTYVQNADNTEDQDIPQEIIISSRDGGGGKYINFSTKSWSITGDNFEEELLPLFQDFKSRMNYESPSNS